MTCVPGVCKSTFVESFIKYPITKGKRVAILSIDPSSQRSKWIVLFSSYDNVLFILKNLI
ncbi:MAG: hypothetical protein HKP59_03910 [Lutibacter sp.]|uniref:hypothetical protein n=1 Tax=Lutibacter sp. TaxID=1925666 RepID=UPI001813DFE9|nr:hypothetical protein [Lutibacter sp.]NNJ57606.1 hypothetical protein [Lutibacter sp.]